MGMGWMYFEKAWHGLETTDGTEVDAVLEGTHGDEEACKETFPVLQEACAC